MDITAKLTEVRTVTVDVDKHELVRKVAELYAEKHPFFKEFHHIENGMVFKYSGFNPHKDESEYSPVRKATKEEQYIWDVYIQIQNLRY